MRALLTHGCIVKLCTQMLNYKWFLMSNAAAAANQSRVRATHNKQMATTATANQMHF